MKFNNYISYAPETLIVSGIFIICGFIFNSKWLLFIGIFMIVLMLTFYRGASIENKLKDVDLNTMISPCDGKVLNIVEHEKEEKIQISIFLNVHNIHVQYVPINGKILSIKYFPGTFHPAYMFQKSQYNERMETLFETGYGEIKLVQIAGLVARRIVSFHEEKQEVKKGAPLGLIKFGSRVDIWIPKNSVKKLLIKKDDRVHIGDQIVELK